MAVRIITKLPGEMPVQTHFNGSIEWLQEFVGGYVELVPINHGLYVACNEDGKVMVPPQEFNCMIMGHSFVGPIVFLRVINGNFRNCIGWLDFSRSFRHLFKPRLGRLKNDN